MRRAGRYIGVKSATCPGELPRIGIRGPIEIAQGSAEDPNPALKGRRQRVAVNVRTDALEQEYSYGRINEASYADFWASPKAMTPSVG
jgi:hypothetical protein